MPSKIIRKIKHTVITQTETDITYVCTALFSKSRIAVAKRVKAENGDKRQGK